MATVTKASIVNDNGGLVVAASSTGTLFSTNTVQYAIVSITGTGSFFMNGNSITVQVGQIIYIPPQVTVSGGGSPCAGFTYMYFKNS